MPPSPVSSSNSRSVRLTSAESDAETDEIEDAVADALVDDEEPADDEPAEDEEVMAEPTTIEEREERWAAPTFG